MRTLLTILFFTSTAAVFGQTIDSSKFSDTSKTKRYVVGDRLIECEDCTIDFCGNLINAKGDTVALNTRALNSTHNPIYFVQNNVLLSTKTAKKLINEKMVKSLTVIKCNNGRYIFGDIAKNGIIVIELVDNFIKTESLEEYLATNFNGNNVRGSAVYINGLLAVDKKLRLVKGDTLELEYNRKTNSYNIRTE
jgi:hypothetical protein